MSDSVRNSEIDADAHTDRIPTAGSAGDETILLNSIQQALI